jgi:hypothetical protein
VDAEIEVIAENAERLYDYICEVRDVISRTASISLVSPG